MDPINPNAPKSYNLQRCARESDRTCDDVTNQAHIIARESLRAGAMMVWLGQGNQAVGVRRVPGFEIRSKLIVFLSPSFFFIRSPCSLP